MKLVEMANVTVMVSDLDVAISFYTQILDFELQQRFGNHWADLSAPGLNIGLHPTSKKIVTAHNMQLGLHVADLNAAMKKLQDDGVACRFNENSQEKLAFFTDPDGNSLYLVQRM